MECYRRLFSSEDLLEEMVTVCATKVVRDWNHGQRDNQRRGTRDEFSCPPIFIKARLAVPLLWITGVQIVLHPCGPFSAASGVKPAVG